MIPIKDETTDEKQTEAVANGYAALEDAVYQLSTVGIAESSILLSVRILYHDIIDDLNEVEN